MTGGSSQGSSVNRNTSISTVPCVYRHTDLSEDFVGTEATGHRKICRRKQCRWRVVDGDGLVEWDLRCQYHRDIDRAGAVARSIGKGVLQACEMLNGHKMAWGIGHRHPPGRNTCCC